jgi:phage/plasmid-like protein (TIGR03299 family)
LEEEVIMAHEVETMMYVGKEPWHGLGTSFPAGTRLGIDEALEAAGLDWEVELRELFTHSGKGARIGVRDYSAVCRTSDNTVLGVVGPGYEPLQNKEAFEWFQPLIDEDEARIDTAGSLRGGRRIWILASVKAESGFVGKTDEIRNFILLSSSHDGSLAVSVGFTPIRVVCANTLAMAHESKASKLLRVRHTARVLDNLAYIREIMNVAEAEFHATVKQYNELARRDISQQDLIEYVKVVFDIKDPDKSKKVLPEVMALFEKGRGSVNAGKTYWGAYNAANEYLNYFRGKSSDARVDSLWFGEGSAINKKALYTALEMAAVS